MCCDHNYRQVHLFYIAVTCNDRVCFLNTFVYINVAYCITKIISHNSKTHFFFFTIWVMPKLLRCMPSFPIRFFEARYFCRINLIVSSSLQKLSTMLFTLDSLSASLSQLVYLRGMILEITSFLICG